MLRTYKRSRARTSPRNQIAGDDDDDDDEDNDDSSVVDNIVYRVDSACEATKPS